MERREKRALAFLLAASLLCLALVALAAGDPPAERAEALFRAGLSMGLALGGRVRDLE